MHLESNIQAIDLWDDGHEVHLFVNWYFWGTILASRWDYWTVCLCVQSRKDSTSSQRSALKTPCCQSHFAVVQERGRPCSTRIQSLVSCLPGPLILFSPRTRAQAPSISASPPQHIYISASEGWRRGIFQQMRVQVLAQERYFWLLQCFCCPHITPLSLPPSWSDTWKKPQVFTPHTGALPRSEDLNIEIIGALDIFDACLCPHPTAGNHISLSLLLSCTLGLVLTL